MTNKKLLKNLLATASTVAVLASGASAFADFVTDGIAPAVTGVGANIRSATGVAPQVPNPATANKIYIGINQPLQFTAATTAVQTVNIYGFAQTIELGAVTLFSVQNDVSAAAIAAANLANGGAPVAVGGGGAGAGAQAVVQFNNVNTSVLSGSTNFANAATGLASVSKIDFNNQNGSILQITDTGTAFGGLIEDSSGNGHGTVAVIGGGTVTFTGAATVAGKIITALTVSNNTTLLLNGGTNLTLGPIANGVTVNDTSTLHVTGAPTNSGDVTLANDGGTLNVDNGGTAAAVTVNAKGIVNVTGGNGAAAVGAVALGTGALNVSGAAGNLGTTGVVTITTGSAVVGAYGTLGGATLTGAGSVSLTDANAVANAPINLDAAGATLNLGAVNGTTAAVAGSTVGAVVTAAGNQGIVNVYATANAASVGVGNALATVNVVSGATLNLTAAANNQVQNLTGAGDLNLNNAAADLSVVNVGAAGAGNSFGTIHQSVNGAALTVTGTNFYGNVATGAGNNWGNVIFTNSLTVNGVLGSDTGILAKATVSGATNAANVNFADSLQSVASLQFVTNAANGISATLTSAPAGLVINTDGANANKATVNFANKDSMKIASIINAGANPLNINLNGGNVQLTAAGHGNAAIAVLNFGTNTSTSTFTVDQIDSIAKITATDAVGGTIAYGNAATQLQSDLGTQTNSLKALTYVGTAASTLDLNGHQTFTASVTASAADVLTVANAGAVGATTYGSFGTAGARLKSLAFVGGNTATVGEIWTKAATVTGGTTVIFTKSVHGVANDATGLQFTGAGTVQFNDGANQGLYMPITTTAANQGVVKFVGASKTSQIGAAGANGSVASVTFSGGKDKTSEIRGSIYSTAAVSFDAGTFNFAPPAATPAVAAVAAVPATATTPAIPAVAAVAAVPFVPITISGGATLAGGTWNLNNNTVTLANGGLTLSAGATIVTTYDQTTKTIGNLAGAQALVLADATPVTITVSGFAASGESLVFSNLTGSGLLVTGPVKAVVKSAQRVTLWTLTASDANTLVFTSSVNPNFVANLQKTGASENAIALANALNAEGATLSGAALNFMNVLGSDAISDAQATEAVNRVTASPDTTSAAHALVGQVNSSIGTRMTQTASPAGIAGGDAAGLGLGVWASGFGAMSTQKANKANPGYKGTVFGGTVGVDAQVTENTSLGLGLTYAGSTLKYKSTKAGDKATSTNMFVNLYGRQVIADDWFVQGNAGFGFGTVKSGAKRLTVAGTYDKASFKYDTMAISLEALAGYNYNVADGVALTPALGLRYVNINEGGYTETGSATNLTVTKKASDKLTGILGTTLASSYDMGGTTVAPEVHAFLEYDFKSKTPKVTAKLDGLSKAFDVTAGKQAKFSANLGTSLTARTDMFEYGIGYDAKLATRYQAHQGTLRLKVSL